MPNGNIRKNYFYNVCFQIFALITPLITAPYISRALGAEGVGTYGYINSIATYFSMFAALGLSSYGLRNASRLRDDPEAYSKLFWELSTLRVISTLICMVIYAGFVVVTGGDIALYAAMGLLVLAVAFDTSWFFQAMENFKSLVIRNFIIKILSVVLTFVLVRGEYGLLIYLLIHAGSMLLSNLMILPQLRKMIKWVPMRRWNLGHHLKETFVYFVPTIATSIYTVLDRTMIGAIIQWLPGGSEEEAMRQTGYYEQAHKIINMMMTVITSLNVVVGVRTSYLFGKDKHDEIRDHIENTMRFMFLLAFPFAAGIVACAPTFVPWFFGKGYDEVIPLMQLFSPLFFIIGISNVLGILYLTPSGQQGKFNIGLLCGAGCNVVMNAVLIPLLFHFGFGARGAVIASVGAELTVTTIFLCYSAAYMPLKQLIRIAFKYLILAAIMFVPVYFIGWALPATIPTTLLQVAVGVAIYAVGLIVTKDPFVKSTLDNLRHKR